jgi:hypothetical protein
MRLRPTKSPLSAVRWQCLAGVSDGMLQQTCTMVAGQGGTIGEDNGRTEDGEFTHVKHGPRLELRGRDFDPHRRANMADRPGGIGAHIQLAVPRTASLEVVRGAEIRGWQERLVAAHSTELLAASVGNETTSLRCQGAGKPTKAVRSSDQCRSGAGTLDGAVAIHMRIDQSCPPCHRSVSAPPKASCSLGRAEHDGRALGFALIIGSIRRL